MKVPEKILITQDEDTKELSEHWCLKNLTNNPHIEYINKDAFIDKACDAYCKVCGHYPHTVPTHICRQDCDYFSDFKKYMKEE